MSGIPARKSLWLLPVSLLLANILNMAGIVVLPKIIDADEFALFSLSSSIGLLIVAVFYEWNRLATVRFSVTPDKDEEIKRRLALRHSNLCINLVLGCVAIICYFFAQHKYFLVASMALMFAISQATFEARQAFFRADFRDKNYAVSLFLRALVGFILLIAVGYMTESALFTMVAWAASFVIILVAFHTALPRLPKRPMDWSILRFLLMFGVGASLTAMATTLLSPAVRMLAAGFIPLADSGKLMLAMDISQKIVGVLGVSISILTIQTTIRAQEFGNDELVRHRIGMQLPTVLAVILPSVIGFILLKDDFAAIFVPEDYTDVFLANIVWCMAAAGALGFRMFALDSVFLVLGRPYTGISGPVFTILGTICAASYYIWSGSVTSVEFSKSLLIGSLGGVLFSVIVVRAICAFTVRWQDVMKIFVAATGMGITVWMCTFDDRVLRMLTSVVFGGGAYCAIIVGLDALGFGGRVKSIFLKRKEI